MKKILVTLDDITIKKGFERKQEIYFVVFGYDPSGQADTIELKDQEDGWELLVPETGELKRWFFGMITPIVQMRKKKKHDFPGEGIILHYGEAKRLVSFYMAIVDSDRRSRNTGNDLKDFFEKLDLGSLGDLVNPAGIPVKAISSGVNLIGSMIGNILSKNKDDIKYSNVFTLAEWDNYLQGTHTDWGNEKVSFTMDIDLFEEIV